MTRLSPLTRVKVEVWLWARSICFLKLEIKNSFTSSCSTSKVLFPADEECMAFGSEVAPTDRKKSVFYEFH